MDRNINQECLALLIKKCSKKITKIYNQFLKSSGLNVTQLNTLIEILDHPLSTTTQIANNLGSERTTLIRNISPLIKKGLLIKTITGKSATYELSQKAKDMIDLANICWEKAQNNIISSFGGWNINELKNNVAKFNNFLNKFNNFS